MTHTPALTITLRRSAARSALLLTTLLCIPINGYCAALPTAVVDFDYYDTSGEARDQTVEHARRMDAFMKNLREGLASTRDYRIIDWRCPATPCTAGTVKPATLAESAREGGAKRLVFGGIHKMSTLIQMGKVYVIDLDSDRVLFERSISFRGDTDKAFDEAAEFVVQQLQQIDQPTR